MRRLCSGLRHLIEIEAAGLLARRELLEALEPLADKTSGWSDHVHMLNESAVILHGDFMGMFERIHAQVGQHRSTERHEWFLPDTQAVVVLTPDGGHSVAITQGSNAAVSGPVDEFL